MDIASVLITAFVVFSIFGAQPKDNHDQKSNRQPGVSYQTVSTNYEFIASNDKTKTLFSQDDDYQVISTYLATRYKKLSPEDREAIATNIARYGQEFNVEPRFVAALIARESGFDRMAVSRSNAKGLGQILDFNYATLQITDPFDIEQAVRGCAKYIGMMLKRWEGKPNQHALALASYNEGSGTITRAGCSWKPETDGYIRDINITYKYLVSQTPITQVSR